MFIKIQPQSTNGGAFHFIAYLEKQNEGKEKNNLLNYLDKQNKDLELNNAKEREYFFSSTKDKVNKIEVFDELEKNHMGLKRNEAKFYTLIISPSGSELKHLESIYPGSYREALKEYTRDIMKGYAVCMNREINGRVLEEKDLVWYGMYENERTFSRRDWEVVHNKAYFKLEKLIKKGEASEEEKEGFKNKKGFYVVTAEGKVEKRTETQKGDTLIKERVKKVAKVGQGHIHVIVHRKDKSGKLSLSPMANSRGKEQVKNVYYREGKRITKIKAQELSKREGKALEEVVEIRREGRMIGFDRTYFKHYAEAAFDHKFDYERKQGERFWDYNMKVKNAKEFFEKHQEKLNQRQKEINSKNSLRGNKIILLRGQQIDLIKKGAKALEGQLKGELKKELGIYKEVEGVYKDTMKVSEAIFRPTETFSKLTPQGLATKLVSKGINLPIKLTLDLLKVRGIEL